MFPVVSRGDPGDHVRPVGGDHRLDEDELTLALAGDLHDHVVRLARHRAARALLGAHLGHRPHVLAVVEGAGTAIVGLDVVEQVRLGLGQEEVLGVAHVRPQLVGHGIHRLEHAVEDLRVGGDDRVGLVGDVEVHRSVVGVDRDLHRVADIVGAGEDIGQWLGVRVAVADGVGVPDPGQPAVGRDDVRVVVVDEERGELLDPLAEGAPEEDL